MRGRLSRASAPPCPAGAGLPSERDGFILAVVVFLQLYHARRVNERVFSENLGFSEPVVAVIAFLTATAGEALLQVARSSFWVI